MNVIGGFQCRDQTRFGIHRGGQFVGEEVDDLLVSCHRGINLLFVGRKRRQLSVILRLECQFGNQTLGGIQFVQIALVFALERFKLEVGYQEFLGGLEIQDVAINGSERGIFPRDVIVDEELLTASVQLNLNGARGTAAREDRIIQSPVTD